MEAARLKAMIDKNAEISSGRTGEDSEFTDEFQEIVAIEGPDETEIGEEDKSIEKMKALIAEWENQRTEEARALLQQGSPEK